jgi:hypothetical protein
LGLSGYSESFESKNEGMTPTLLQLLHSPGIQDSVFSVNQTVSVKFYIAKMNKCCKKKIIEYLEKARGQKNKLRS